MELRGNVIDFFGKQLEGLDCQKLTQAYIVGIFGKYRTADFDLSKESLTLKFAEARTQRDFAKFQTIGDWIFFSQSLMPQHLHYASKDYYDTVARLSFYSCYQLLNRQWQVYEELADDFVPLNKEVSIRLNKIICF